MAKAMHKKKRFSKAEKERWAAEHFMVDVIDADSRLVDGRYTTWARRDGTKVSLRIEEKIKYVPKHVKKKERITLESIEPWSYYKLIEQWSVTIKDGKPVIYQYIPKVGVKTQSYKFIHASTEAFLEAVCLMMGRKFTEDFALWHITMPRLAEVMTVQSVRGRPGARVGKLFSLPSVYDICRAVWGKKTKAHVKDAVRWMTNGQFGHFEVALDVKGLVPHEHVSSATISDSIAEMYRGSARNGQLRQLFKLLTPTAILRLLEGPAPHSLWSRYDTLNALKTLGRREAKLLLRRQGMPKDWRHLHDVFTARAGELRLLNQKKKLSALKIPSHSLSQELSKLSIATSQGNLSIKIPENGYEIALWGEKLRHCIGSYAEMAAQSRCLLFGVYLGDKLLATGELARGAVRQLYGLHNQRMNNEMDRAVCCGVLDVLDDISRKRPKDVPTALLPHTNHLQDALDELAF